jgi:hypothetical protein
MRHDRIMTEAKKRNAIIPRQGTDCYKVLEAMFDGHKLTVLTSPKIVGCCAISQRCRELEHDYNWPILKHWKKLRSGKRVKEYFLFS